MSGAFGEGVRLPRVGCQTRGKGDGQAKLINVKNYVSGVASSTSSLRIARVAVLLSRKKSVIQ